MASFLPPSGNNFHGLGFHRRGQAEKRLPNPSSVPIYSFKHLGNIVWCQGVQRLHGHIVHANLGGNPLPSAPNVPQPNKGIWGILWSILSLILPFWKSKFKTLIAIESEMEEVVETVAKVVEEVAEVAEKVSEELAENLPEGSKLREAAAFIECASKEAEKDAEITLGFMHKVDELKEEIESLETQVEMVVEQGMHEPKEKQS